MKMNRTIPVLRIFDEDVARAFYVEFLGFTVDWEHRFGDNFPLYCQVSKDDCLLHLSGHHGDACPGAAVVVSIEGVHEYNAALLAKDYKHAKPGLEETEWGTRQMSIQDPFGNRLTFSEQLESED